jgi:hypothetical protein
MAARFGRARCRPRNLRRGPQLESCLARSLEMGVIVVRYARVCRQYLWSVRSEHSDKKRAHCQDPGWI